MLLFHRAPEDFDLRAARYRGRRASEGADLRLFPTLAGAMADGGLGPLLVVDGTRLDQPVVADTVVRVCRIPAAALQNVDPYRPPSAVVAGGGYVVCALPNDVALLLIYRRGQWELPKGKKDPGETVEACAAREVREEVGIEQLKVYSPLGATQHGYPSGEVYAVKTTHWFLMRTPERSFAPDQREGIRRVAWARWAVARAHMAHDTTRRHMNRVEGTVRASV